MDEFDLDDTWLTQPMKNGGHRSAYLEGEAYARFASQVRTLREQRGWTPNELALHAGCVEADVREIEAERLLPQPMEVVDAIACAFGLGAAVTFRINAADEFPWNRVIEVELVEPPGWIEPRKISDRLRLGLFWAIILMKKKFPKLNRVSDGLLRML